MTEDREAAKTITGKQVAWGFGTAMLLHLLLLLCLAADLGFLYAMPGQSGSLAFILLMGALNPGASQLLYEVPLLLYFRRRGESGKLRGVLIAMGLTILLNGLCWAALATNKIRIGG